jgi:hypothetical protein
MLDGRLPPTDMHSTAADPLSLFQRLRSLGESPWFWALLLVNGAIVGLLLISPKYRQREGMLERRYEARREIAVRQATGLAPLEAAGPLADPHAQDRPLLVPLWRLLLVLVVLDLVALTIFVWRRNRSGAGWTQPQSNGT